MVNKPPAADAGPRQPSDPNIICRERLKKLSFLITGNDYAFFSANPQIEEALKVYVANAVPPVPQEAAPSSNSITVARESFTQADTQELTKCPTCNGYHIGGCHRATAPDEAMRLSIDICRELYDRFVMGGWEPQDAHEQCADFIRQAGSGRERELREALQRWPFELDSSNRMVMRFMRAEWKRLLGGELK